MSNRVLGSKNYSKKNGGNEIGKNHHNHCEIESEEHVFVIHYLYSNTFSTYLRGFFKYFVQNKRFSRSKLRIILNIN